MQWEQASVKGFDQDIIGSLWPGSNFSIANLQPKEVAAALPNNVSPPTWMASSYLLPFYVTGTNLTRSMEV
jgi:hypothetical protein